MRCQAAVVVAVSTALLALSACTATPSGQSTAGADLPVTWKAQFDQALSDPKLSSFARQVLSDYEITPSEYQESFDRFSQCVTDSGYTVRRDSTGFAVGLPAGQAVSDQAMSDMDEVVGACEGPDSDSAWITISTIYQVMIDDPQGLTTEQLIRVCYQAHGVPDGAGLSDDQFAQLVSDINYVPSTPEATLCYWDPTGSQG